MAFVLSSFFRMLKQRLKILLAAVVLGWNVTMFSAVNKAGLGVDTLEILPKFHVMTVFVDLACTLKVVVKKKKPEMGDFHVSKLQFLGVQIFFVHLFALRYQIP